MANLQKQIGKDMARFKQKADNRGMDAICDTDGNFALQSQQNFLKEYISYNKSWKHLLLYHGIGSGKTWTAITLAEAYMAKKKNVNVKVILPARLRSNFIDELVSPCGMSSYISAEDSEAYHDSDTSASEKRAIKKEFMDLINDYYEFISFDKFRSLGSAAKNLKKWASDFTENSLIIVDEVHNALSSTYNKEMAEAVIQSGKPSKMPGFTTILFKIMNMYAHPTAKFIFLTATPVFDNIGQVRELAEIMTPKDREKISQMRQLDEIIKTMVGKVSYFPGVSKNAYPTQSDVVHELPMSVHHDDEMHEIQLMGANDNEDNNTFLIKERQASIVCPGSSSEEDLLSNLTKYCPKIKRLMKVINEWPARGKHVVYSSFIEKGLDVIAKVLEKNGWTNVMEVDKADAVEYKSFAIWSGDSNDDAKHKIKRMMNSKLNIDGKNIRVLLGSPSIKEGVSFKHIQHLHLIDAVWNANAKMQIEGRAIRFCSHVDIDKNSSDLKRHVVINTYKLMPKPRGKVELTCDQHIYDDIIPSKLEKVSMAEAALKSVSIDYELFKPLYSKEEVQAIRQLKDVSIHKGSNSTEPKPASCPKARRPVNGRCPDGSIKKQNKKGEDCCYKSRKAKSIAKSISKSKAKSKGNTCPKARRPVDGKCSDGMIMRRNKQGFDCCYKR